MHQYQLLFNPQNREDPAASKRRVVLSLLGFFLLGFAVALVSNRHDFLRPEQGSGDTRAEDDDSERLFSFKNSNDSLTLHALVEYCEQERARGYDPQSFQYRLAAANCGWGYDFMNSKANKDQWKVFFFGPGFRKEILDLSGCPNHCPLSPKCEIHHQSTNRAYLKDADVVVVFQADSDMIPLLNKKPYRVLYWREAVFKTVSVGRQRDFSFEMGSHFYAGLLNPSFTRSPKQLLDRKIFPFPHQLPLKPLSERTGFAMSIISHCGAGSLRDEYLRGLTIHLGPERVHQFGRCGNMKLPPKPINNAAMLISTYKFFLSMENTIQDGYVTEKLFFALNFPVVPVYYGALNAPNITKVQSFIRAADFRTPKELALYLMHLDQNPPEYQRYHEWRSKPEHFTDEFLEIQSRKVAGPEELSYYKKRKFKRFPRTSQCCRLCDENYVKYAAESRTEQSFVRKTMSQKEILARFFNKH